MRFSHNFLLLLLISSSVFAQSDFRPGKITFTDGRIKNGFINYTSDDQFRINCTFKESPDSKPFNYSYFQLVSFGFDNGRKFVSLEFQGETNFYEVLVEGILNVFYKRENSEDMYFVRKMPDGELTYLPYKETHISDGSKNYISRSSVHKGLLMNLTGDAPEMTKDIARIAEPSHRNLVKIAKEYHEMVCDTLQCMVYTRNLPPVAVLLEPHLSRGTMISSGGGSAEGKMEEYGINAFIWLPRANERVYILTGVGYCDMRVTGINSEIGLLFENSSGALKIPLSLTYMPLSGRINPHFSIGVNFFDFLKSTSLTQGFFAQAGINVRIAKPIFLKLSVNGETYSGRKLAGPKLEKTNWLNGSAGILIRPF